MAVVDQRQGQKVGCHEAVAYLKSFIGRDELIVLGNELEKSGYGKYLLEIAEEV